MISRLWSTYYSWHSSQARRARNPLLQNAAYKTHYYCDSPEDLWTIKGVPNACSLAKACFYDTSVLT
jgi:hypothetical protein